MKLDKSALDQLTPDELRRYVDFLLWHYKVMDGFWFIYATEQFGQPAAEKLNEKVWARVGGMAAKDLKARFGIQEKGLPGFVKVLRLYPWTLLVGYEVEAREQEVILTVPASAAPARKRASNAGWASMSARRCTRRNSRAWRGWPMSASRSSASSPRPIRTRKSAFASGGSR